MSIFTRISGTTRRFTSKVSGLALLAAGRLRAQLPNIRREWQGQNDNSDSAKHAVFVHFDVEGQVHDFTVIILKALIDAGFAITFVSNSPKLPERSLDLLKPLTRVILHRYNSGYDFAAYRDGIKAIPALEQSEALLLMNDSVYGPLFPLKEAMEGAQAAGYDAWGITDSWEFKYHIQGYFMLFFNRAIRSKQFAKFWRQFPNISNKNWVIQNGEVKLTSKLAQDKLKIGVMCPYWKVAEGMLGPLRAHLSKQDKSGHSGIQNDFLASIEANIVAGIPMNQTHFMWEELIRNWDCPFIKRELVLKNPVAVPFNWRWRQVIEECSDYDCELIEQHLYSL